MKEINANARDNVRIEALSDGVFAVALTVLALEITVPENSLRTNRGLLDSLLHLWPKYFAYGLSFITVLAIWFSNRNLFRILKTSNTYLIFANGMVLLLVALIPFPTRTLGDSLNTNASGMSIIFYCGFLALFGIFNYILLRTAIYKRTLLIEGITEEKIKLLLKQITIGVTASILIFIIALIFPWAGLILRMAILPYWIYAAGREVWR